jgi:hypothetical protein
LGEISIDPARNVSVELDDAAGSVAAELRDPAGDFSPELFSRKPVQCNKPMDMKSRDTKKN